MLIINDPHQVMFSVVLQTRNRKKNCWLELQFIAILFQDLYIDQDMLIPWFYQFYRKKNKLVQKRKAVLSKEMVGVSTNPNFVKYALGILILSSGFTLTEKRILTIQMI
jgi:hypothetical protein